MKYLLTAIVFCFCFAGMSATEYTTEKLSSDSEVLTQTSFSSESTVFLDRGKKNKRRIKRIKAKRKRKCQKAARRNFAG